MGTTAWNCEVVNTIFVVVVNSIFVVVVIVRRTIGPLQVPLSVSLGQYSQLKTSSQGCTALHGGSPQACLYSNFST